MFSLYDAQTYLGRFDGAQMDETGKILDISLIKQKNPAGNVREIYGKQHSSSKILKTSIIKV